MKISTKLAFSSLVHLNGRQLATIQVFLNVYVRAHMCVHTHIHVLTMLSTNSTNEIHPLPAVTFKTAIFTFVLLCVCLLHPCVEAREQPQLSLLKTYLPYF